MSCGRHRPHAPLTSAHPRAHLSDAHSPGRSTSSESFALIALGHAHLLQRFEGDAAGARAALDVCMLPLPPLATAIRSAMDGSSAACLWSCVHALHCDAFDLPHVLVAVSMCDLSCFGHVSMVLYINILWYVRAPDPSMVPGPATWLLTSTTRR